MATKKNLSKLLSLLVAGTLTFGKANADNRPRHEGLCKYGDMEIVGKDTTYYVLTPHVGSEKMSQFYQEQVGNKNMYKVTAKDLRKYDLETELYTLAGCPVVEKEIPSQEDPKKEDNPSQVPNLPPQEPVGANNTINQTTKITNNYIITNNYGKQDSAKIDTTKRKRDLIVLTEAGYGTSTKFNAMVSPQLKISNNLSVGPYLQVNSFKNKETNTTLVDKTDAIIPGYLYSRTEGTITDNFEKSKPLGYGVLLSATMNDEKLMGNLGLGLLKIKSKDGKEIHEGTDSIIEDGEFTETKPYFYPSGEEIKESSNVPIIKASVNYFPFEGKAKNLYFGLEAQQSLKSKSEKFKHSSLNAKVGWRFKK